MSGPFHRLMVAELVAEGCKVRGFPRAMRDLGAATSLLPDAYRIRPDARTVVAFEVVVSEPVTRDRRARYRQLRAALENLGWSLDVIRVRVARRRVSQRLD